MPLHNIIEFDAKVNGQTAHLNSPHRRQHARSEQDRVVIRQGAESEAGAGEFGIVIAAVIKISGTDLASAIRLLADWASVKRENSTPPFPIYRFRTGQSPLTDTY